jgi:hypothetical protein
MRWDHANRTRSWSDAINGLRRTRGFGNLVWRLGRHTVRLMFELARLTFGFDREAAAAALSLSQISKSLAIQVIAHRIVIVHYWYPG